MRIFKSYVILNGDSPAASFAFVPQAQQVVYNTREGDVYRYELTEDGAYEVLYSPLPPERLDALTRPN